MLDDGHDDPGAIAGFVDAILRPPSQSTTPTPHCFAFAHTSHVGAAAQLPLDPIHYGAAAATSPSPQQLLLLPGACSVLEEARVENALRQMYADRLRGSVHAIVAALAAELPRDHVFAQLAADAASSQFCRVRLGEVVEGFLFSVQAHQYHNLAAELARREALLARLAQAIELQRTAAAAAASAADAAAVVETMTAAATQTSRPLPVLVASARVQATPLTFDAATHATDGRDEAVAALRAAVQRLQEQCASDAAARRAAEDRCVASDALRADAEARGASLLARVVAAEVAALELDAARSRAADAERQRPPPPPPPTQPPPPPSKRAECRNCWAQTDGEVEPAEWAAAVAARFESLEAVAGSVAGVARDAVASAAEAACRSGVEAQRALAEALRAAVDAAAERTTADVARRLDAAAADREAALQAQVTAVSAAAAAAAAAAAKDAEAERRAAAETAAAEAAALRRECAAWAEAATAAARVLHTAAATAGAVSAEDDRPEMAAVATQASLVAAAHAAAQAVVRERREAAAAAAVLRAASAAECAREVGAARAHAEAAVARALAADDGAGCESPLPPWAGDLARRVANARSAARDEAAQSIAAAAAAAAASAQRAADKEKEKEKEKDDDDNDERGRAAIAAASDAALLSLLRERLVASEAQLLAVLGSRDAELADARAQCAAAARQLQAQERRNAELHERCAAKERELARLRGQLGEAPGHFAGSGLRHAATASGTPSPHPPLQPRASAKGSCVSPSSLPSPLVRTAVSLDAAGLTPSQPRAAEIAAGALDLAS